MRRLDGERCGRQSGQRGGVGFTEKSFVQDTDIQRINEQASRGLVMAVVNEEETCCRVGGRSSELEIRDEGSASLMG